MRRKVEIGQCVALDGHRKIELHKGEKGKDDKQSTQDKQRTNEDKQEKQSIQDEQ